MKALIPIAFASITCACSGSGPGSDSAQPPARSFVQRSAPSPCDIPTATQIARVYFLSMPIIETDGRVKEHVIANRDYFTATGRAIACAALLGPRLIQSGVNTYDPQAYERVMRKGPDELAPDVAKSINSGAIDLLTMGKELIWLSQVLPSAAEGNWEKYETTGTEARNQARAAFGLMAPLLSLEDRQTIIAATSGGVQELAEQQVLMLAVMAGANR